MIYNKALTPVGIRWDACKFIFENRKQYYRVRGDCLSLIIFPLKFCDAELDDLRYGGCQFTWANKQANGRYITSKIDRVLVNEEWTKMFPQSNAAFPPPGASDHSPALVYISVDREKTRKPF